MADEALAAIDGNVVLAAEHPPGALTVLQRTEQYATISSRQMGNPGSLVKPVCNTNGIYDFSMAENQRGGRAPV